jgi:hypothetical protein
MQYISIVAPGTFYLATGLSYDHLYVQFLFLVGFKWSFFSFLYSFGLVLLVEETGVPGENHRPAAVASHWQTLSRNFVSSKLKMINRDPRYNWNIAESGIKHHNPYPSITIPRLAFLITFLVYPAKYSI